MLPLGREGQGAQTARSEGIPEGKRLPVGQGPCSPNFATSWAPQLSALLIFLYLGYHPCSAHV